MRARRRSARSIAGGVGMENEMRLSRSRHVELALACGFVLTALVFAAPYSVAEAGGATVSRDLALHERSVDPRRRRAGPGNANALLAAVFRILRLRSKEAGDGWVEPEPQRLREVWLHRQWRLRRSRSPAGAERSNPGRRLRGLLRCAQRFRSIGAVRGGKPHHDPFAAVGLSRRRFLQAQA